MATEISKTYSITLKYTYEDSRAIAEDDLHVAELRGKIIDWINSKVAHVQQGDLSAHIVGTITET